ncbi:MAG: hypothetical protein JO189_31585 [Deltaproteobacteria bacterium]|nr:hypothetical protein [Deltaproteobacteria bacterium]
MAAIITGILTAFAIMQAAAPLLELLLTYLAKYMAHNAKMTWADQADENLAAATQAVQRIVSQVTIDPVTALNHVELMYPTAAMLEKAFPGICQSIMARHILMADVPGISHGMAAKLIEGAHAQSSMAAVEE